MAKHVGICKIFFDDADGAGASDWARGMAQWLKDNTEALAQQARLVNPGTAAEETSYCMNALVNDDGTLTVESAWHLDNNGNVQQGMPVADAPVSEPDPTEYPAWVEWDGNNENLHQIGDIVTHNGQSWIATAGDNHWEPGVFGWEVYTQ